MKQSNIPLQDYMTLYRLALGRLQSEAAYREFQAMQASMILRYLQGNGVNVAGQRLLDLGSGLGGYSDLFSKAGADVVSMDLMADRIRPRSDYESVAASATAVPLQDGSIDVVFCASLIEHVAKPEQVIAEIERVLRPGGACYLSFPPFYSPRGGHEYAPWHYLGERWAIRIAGDSTQKYHPDWIQDIYQVSAAPQSYAGIYADWGLYVLTVRKARRLIAESGLTCVDLSTRYMPVSFIRWPLAGEVLTWHAQFLLRKPHR